MNYENKKVVLKRRPEGYPSPDDFEMRNEVINSINHGEVIIQILWLSLDRNTNALLEIIKD